ncbi:hypothetical protein [Nonomuraea sp. LPB2021202275-12-8]|uniref:hypothetical protein n=1 Tax=Nonomuraea sp. LPB2021202275-12-8 TaxID=3120159 RepID=UPI00300C07C2
MRTVTVTPDGARPVADVAELVNDDDASPACARQTVPGTLMNAVVAQANIPRRTMFLPH